VKIVLLGDTHFGARNSNSVIESWQKRFYNEVFWPYIEQTGIKTVIQTGDFFDNRKWLNIQTVAFQKEVFVKPAQQLGVNVHVIIGNHDCPLRHSLQNNSVQQILGHEPFFKVYSTSSRVQFEDREVTFMPWICKENEEEMMSELHKGGDIIVGHFELQGALMHPGAFSQSGLKHSDFSKWNHVLSGHFHAQSETGNIHYIGTPYQMSWNDSSTRHGFWVLDTTDGSKTFIENPLRYFNKYTWNDNDSNQFVTSNLKNSYVKINVKKKSDFEEFEKFIDKINFGEPFEVKITESFEEYRAENVEDFVELSTTSDLIKEYIDDIASVNKDDIKKLMNDIYNEALTLEE
jgi:DNA repair exonuclease SbcCD nuclease subunit